MPEFNLLKTVPNIKRDVKARLVNKEENRALAMKFEEEYFDGPREQGYGGYKYDGRWIEISKTAAERYDLKSGDRILDIGCAKGFFVRDVMDVVPGIDAYGIDISSYALKNCHPQIIGRLHKGHMLELPFPDNSFDAVFNINTLHNLDNDGCINALKEMNRVCRNPDRQFVQVDAYRNDEELELFETWMLTAKTYCKPDEWIDLFVKAEYVGDYFWTILEFETVK